MGKRWGFALVVALSGCAGMGGPGGLGFDDDEVDLDWSTAGFDDPQTEWTGFGELDEADASRCAKGVRPSEVRAVDPYAEPEQGEMRVQVEGQVVALPLAQTSFDTIVLGTIADTQVRQVFENPYDEPIEAVYVFPLPNDAAIDGYAIEVGDRTMRGVMKTRADARAAYEHARDEGRSAGLLEQERPNIFTQNVANIPPGKKITVVMHMIGPVHQEHGHFELALPTVVGPRYVPGNPTGQSGGGYSPDTDRVPDGSRITPEVLPPGTVGCAELAVRVELDPGAPVDVVSSKSHAIDVDRGGGPAVVELAAGGEPLNRDFVLGWSVAAQTPTTSLVIAPDDPDRHFMLTINPPQFEHAGEAAPRELVFVLDTSGSMSGLPMAASKAAMRGFLSNMRRDDAFQIIRFSSDASSLGRAPLPATPENVRRALRHVDRLESSGGTEMMMGLRAALDFPYTAGRARYVLFLTDGYIGNEQEIFEAVSARSDQARIFSLGVGSSPNRHLLDALARTGRGAVTYVDNEESPAAAVGNFYRRLSHPVLTDLELDFGDLQVADVVPRRIPDLFTGQPVVVYGRLAAGPRGRATLRGRRGSETVAIDVPIDTANARRTHGIGSMWARARIQQLEDSRIANSSRDIETAVTTIALHHNVMSEYTSFVAIDQDHVVNPDGAPVRVDVPVELPEGADVAGFGGEIVAEFEDADMDDAMSEPAAPAAMAPRHASRSVLRREALRVRAKRDAPDPAAIATKRAERAARRSKRAIGKCFDAAAARGNASGVVTARLTIDDTGAVLSVSFEDAPDAGLETCLETIAQSWTIRRPGDGRLVIEVELLRP
jgi:Ca-activated chloride channel family protein